MRRLRHILSLLITLTFMVGVTVQAAHVDRMGSMPERVDTAMHMDQAGSDGCPDCDMGKAAMQGAACQSVCIAMPRSEEHTSELQSLMRTSYAVFCLKKRKKQPIHTKDCAQS